MTLILTKNKKKYWQFIRTLRSNKSVENGFIDNSKIQNELNWFPIVNFEDGLKELL